MTPDQLEAIRRGGNLYALGVMPSGVTAKDFLASDPDRPPGASAPTFIHPATRKIPVKNQQGSTCVGNSVALCLEYLEYVERDGQVVNVPGEELNGRITHKQGEASSPHDVLDETVKHGARVTMSSGVEGLLYPKAYAAIDWRNPEALRAAMSSPGTMVTASVWLTRAFDEAADDHTYATEDASLLPWVYHELTFVGYDQHGVLCQNSWGTWWGDDGFVRLGWDYVAARLGECWAITDNADTAGGYIQTYDFGSLPEVGIARPDLPTRKRPAVYLVMSDGRRWIKDPFEAKRFGVKLPPTRVPDTDPRWALPVIGPDAPANLR